MQVATLSTTTFKDGTYTGTGSGYRPNLQLQVTIKSNKIMDIQIVSSDETPRFFDRAFTTVSQEIISSESTSVDAVPGATRSSNGITSAVADALKSATN